MDIKDYNYSGNPRRASRFTMPCAKAETARAQSRNIVNNVVIVSILAVIIISVVVIIQT